MNQEKLNNKSEETKLPPQMENPEEKILELQKKLGKLDTEEGVKSVIADADKIVSAIAKEPNNMDDSSDEKRREKMIMKKQRIEEEKNNREEEPDWDAQNVAEQENNPENEIQEVSTDVKDASEFAETEKTDTIINAEKPEDTKIMPEVPKPERIEKSEDALKFESLLEEKNKIEIELSKTEDEKKKKELTELKKIKSLEIIKQGCVVADLDFDEEKKKMEVEKEREWIAGVEASGFKDLQSYERWHRKIYYDDVIKNKSGLSGSQINELLEKGNVVVASWKSSVEFDKDDLVALSIMGIKPGEVKRKSFFSKKLYANGEFLANSVDDLNAKIEEAKKRIDDVVYERMSQRKNEIIEKGVEQVVLDKEIKKIQDNLLGKELLAKNVEEKRQKEEEKNAKIEEAKNLSPEKKLELINNIRKNWSKTEKMFNLLQAKKGKIKTEDGKTLEVGKDNEEIEKLREKYSTDVVRFANELAGYNLMEECKKEVGYNSKEEPKNLEKQKEFRNLLTQRIKELYQNKKAEIELETGKKIKLKKRTSKIKDLEAIESLSPVS